MRRVLVLTVMCLIFCMAFSQEKVKLYDPAADAKADIAAEVSKASKEKKHVILMVGGNWCSWCYKFSDFSKQDKQIDSVFAADYIVYHLNYSKDNKNDDLMMKYGFPQRFGFPVFVVLDENGKMIHTQSSWYLEEGKSYSKEKVMDFLANWNVKAFDPSNYKE